VNNLILNPRVEEKVVERLRTPEQHKHVPAIGSLSEPKKQERRLYPVKPKESIL
jgi:hypothetical protein